MATELSLPASGEGGLTAETIRERPALEQLSSAWDALAVASARPYSTPDWALSWWDHLRPPSSRLCSIAVWEDARLVGLLPLALSTDRWGVVTGHLLGHDVASYTEPLASPGDQRRVAAAFTSELRSCGDRIDVLSLAGIPDDSPWPALLRQSWPGRRPRLSLVSTMPAPYADIPAGGFDEWFAATSRNFRQQMRRRRRDFVRLGGEFRRAESAAEMLCGLAELERLHLGRWSGRGGSQAFGPGVRDHLKQVGTELGPGRMQYWTANVGSDTVAAALFLSAGDEMHYWISGFDENWGALSVSILVLVEAMRHAADLGLRRVSFGPGAQPYKYRLATAEERLDWVDLIPRQHRYPLVSVVQSPRRAYRLAARRTPDTVKQRVKGWFGRPTTGTPGADG